jgi:hypothetical protein
MTDGSMLPYLGKDGNYDFTNEPLRVALSTRDIKIVDILGVECLPGKYKKFVFNYPKIEWRQISVQAKDLRSALKQADKRIGKDRSGLFRLSETVISNFHQGIVGWQFLTRHFGGTSINGGTTMAPKHKCGLMLASSLDIEDEYFK